MVSWDFMGKPWKANKKMVVLHRIVHAVYKYPLVNAYKKRLQENYQRVLGMVLGSSLRALLQMLFDVFG